MQHKKTFALIQLFLVLNAGLNAHGQITLISWNIQDMGGTKDDSEISQIAQVIRHADLVAIQEVVAMDHEGAKAVARLCDHLNRLGSKWDYAISDPTKSPSPYMSERYAYLWKTSSLQVIGRPFLDKVLEIECYREPYIATFRIRKANQSFVIVNFHSRPHDKQPWEEFARFSEYPDRLTIESIVIAGDFNTPDNHHGFDRMRKSGFLPCLKSQPTTLKRQCGENGDYTNYPIDNIWTTAGFIKVISTRVIDIVQDCKNLKKARLLSDHLPVELVFKI
jgi:endonuclease/exonuclease/phosphatase family metal-dependent hydrolase